MKRQDSEPDNQHGKSDTDMDMLIDMAKQAALKIVPETELMPVLLAVDTQKRVHVVGFAELNEEVKNSFHNVVQSFLRHVNAIAYVFSHEAWIAMPDPKGQQMKQLLSGEVAVSELPLDDRSEAVVITGCTRGGRTRMLFAIIDRVPFGDRQIREWEDKEDKEGGDAASGRMVVSSW